jgi:farnesyl-diphosphate farnesyltransferase
MTPERLEPRNLLKQVSRSFYLTLRVLPHSVRRPISLAYLLARAADTIADTGLIEVPRRQEALLQLRESIGEASENGREKQVLPPAMGDLAGAQESIVGEGTPAERILLEHLRELLVSLQSLARDDRMRIRKLLDTITRGQETDLLRFRMRDQICALETEEELEEYAYRVAGCVGEFWTEMCRAHVFPAAGLNDESLLADGVRFGKGLQLVNILRDFPKDLRRGRCYIPQNQLSKYGLIPRDLLDPAAMDRFRPLYDCYLQKAEEYLAAGRRYTLALPFRCVRVRLACAWPLLIGSKTLGQLWLANVLDDGNRVKVGRSEIRRLVLRSAILYPNPRAWNLLINSAGNKESA